MDECQRLITMVTQDKNLVSEGMPAIFVKDEEELEKIASELGKIFYAKVKRLSNGCILIIK